MAAVTAGETIDIEQLRNGNRDTTGDTATKGRRPDSDPRLNRKVSLG